VLKPRHARDCFQRKIRFGEQFFDSRHLDASNLRLRRSSDALAESLL
jgi:hypothetical protein